MPVQLSRRRFVQALAAAQVAPATPGRPWWLRPVRMFHPNMSEADVAGIDTKRFIEDCSATQCNSVVVSASGIYAFYPSRIQYHFVSGLLNGRDFLGEVVELGHAAGLKVVARVDFSKAREEVFRDHPDWFSRRADGSYSRSGRFYQSCPNSPYSWEAFAGRVIREILENYAVDGFHLNAGGFPGHCYCPYCREKFRSRFGTEIPAGANWDGTAWKQYIAWRYDASAENFALLHRVMQDARRDVFWTGELAGLDDPSWTRNRAYDIVRLSRAMSSLMSTIDNISPGPDMRWVCGMTASYARTTGQRTPIINLKAHMRDGGWPRASVPAAEYAMNCWQAMAHGAGLKNPIFGIPDRGDDDRNLAVITRAYGLLKEHAWVYEDTQPVAPVAIIWSHRTLEMYGRDDPRSRYAENFYGLYAALTESHIPCLVAGDDWLTAERLKSFRAVALPNMACLSGEQILALTAFVRGGGGLVATYETSRFTESGGRREGFGLAEVLGVETVPGDIGNAEAPKGAYLCRPRSHPAVAWMRDTAVIPFGYRYVRTRAAPGATAALVYGEHANAGIPEEVDSPVRSETPMCVLSTPGTGRAVYFAGEVDRFCFRNRLPDTRRLLEGALRWALKDEDALRSNAPGCAALTLWRKPGFLFVHFVNAVGRSPLDEVTEVACVETTVRTASKVKSVRALAGRSELEFAQQGGAVRFRLPRLGEYEVAVIETSE